MRTFSTIMLIALCLFPFPLLYAQSYTITNLQSLGGDPPNSTANGINDAGEVVGSSNISTAGNQVIDAFTWTVAGGMHDLGIGPGVSTSVNSRGNVVGSFGTTTISAFIWNRTGGFEDLGSLGGNAATATKVNTSGEVVGYSLIDPRDNHTWHAFLWTRNNGMVDLGNDGGNYAWANDVNDAGQIVGSSTIAGDKITRAVLWIVPGVLQDLGTLGGTDASANAINNSGTIVGNACLAGDQQRHAFLWTELEGMEDLGTLGGAFSNAVAINNENQVVGWTTTASGETVAFIWEQGKGMRNLNDEIPAGSGWVLTRAVNINDAGEIIGGGYLHNQRWPYLLTPKSDSPQ